MFHQPPDTDEENVRWYQYDRNKDAQMPCKDAGMCSAVVSNAADSEKTAEHYTC